MLEIRIKTMFQDEGNSKSSGKRIVETFTELDLTGKIIMKLEAALPLTLLRLILSPKASVLIFISRMG
jgi:hypothetical protein